MTDLPAPAATRLRRPSWRDARLLTGIALVLLATALGAIGLRAADSRVEVYAARAGLLPGQRLAPEDVTTVAVQLSEAGGTYVAVADGLPAEGFVTREVRAGELLPRSAVGEADDIALVPLAIATDQATSGALVVGSRVTVYANKPVQVDGRDGWGGPQEVLADATVSRLTTNSGFGAGSSRSGIQLLVPERSVTSVIALVDEGAKFTLVPIPGSLVRESS